MIARIAMSWILHYMPFARTLRQAGMTVAALTLGEEWTQMDNRYINADLLEERMHEDVYIEAHSQRVWTWSQRKTKSADRAPTVQR